MFIDWYEWYWSESSYFLYTSLSFGWLSESSPGFSLFFYCQTAGWLVLWKSVVGSSLVLPDKGSGSASHRLPSYPATQSDSCRRATPGCCPTTAPLPNWLLWEADHLLPQLLVVKHLCSGANKNMLIKLGEHQIHKSNNAVCCSCHWLQRDLRPHSRPRVS